MNLKKIDDFLLFNFLAKDKQHVEEMMEAGQGYIVPGIVSSDFTSVENGKDKVNELKL